MENMPSKINLEAFADEIQKLNLSIHESDLKLMAEKHDADEIIYSKLETALNNVEIWIPVFEQQIDLSAKSGYGPLISRNDIIQGLHYYTLNASNSNQSYLIRLMEYNKTTGYGTDRFKFLINAFSYLGRERTYLTIIKRDNYTLIRDMLTKNLHRNPKILSREDAERTINLLISAPFLFKKATENLQLDQQKKIAEIQEQKDRVSKKEIPESF